MMLQLLHLHKFVPETVNVTYIT